MNTPRPTWTADPATTPELAAAMARYDALTPPERQRVARLVALTNAPLGLAVAAVEAVRPQPEEKPR